MPLPWKTKNRGNLILLVLDEHDLWFHLVSFGFKEQRDARILE
jgi:hypothetical protein